MVHAPLNVDQGVALSFADFVNNGFWGSENAAFRCFHTRKHPKAQFYTAATEPFTI